jgi:hypothetical protein
MRDTLVLIDENLGTQDYFNIDLARIRAPAAAEVNFQLEPLRARLQPSIWSASSHNFPRAGITTYSSNTRSSD